MEDLVGVIRIGDAARAPARCHTQDDPYGVPPPSPAGRVPVHSRDIACCGYRRTDGLWDIEARMTDRKGYAVHNDYRTVDAGAPFHDMALRVTVDDTLLIPHDRSAPRGRAASDLSFRSGRTFSGWSACASKPDLAASCAGGSAASAVAPISWNCSDHWRRRPSRRSTHCAAQPPSATSPRRRRRSMAATRCPPTARWSRNTGPRFYHPPC